MKHIKSLRKNILFFYFFIFFASLASFASADETIRARAIFVGDIMAHAEQVESAKKSADVWDFAPQFRRVKPLFMSKSENENLIVGNLETVFAGPRVGFAGYPSFNTPDSLADALVDLGVDVVTLANNHILDRGLSGALRTTEVLDNTGIFWTGLRKSIETDAFLKVEHSGITWAFVNFTYGSNRAPTSGDISLNIISESAVIDAISQARASNPDFIVACFHWGNEYQYAPTKRQKDIASLAFANGAALVIGTHPHVLQPIEILNADGNAPRVVAWSLGNFVSHQRTEPRERSVILAVDVEKTSSLSRITRVSIAPTRVSATKTGGKRKIEVVYAGESPRFNHAGLPKTEVAAARKAGKTVLDFLGARETFDNEGFYTLWEEN
ncbi:capsule biosynthesis protein [Synergistales bacterium]|nr:capsule biosynthesis protein [Synergistales bacterium]